jgi:hypothetical protein
VAKASDWSATSSAAARRAVSILADTLLCLLLVDDDVFDVCVDHFVDNDLGSPDVFLRFLVISDDHELFGCDLEAVGANREVPETCRLPHIFDWQPNGEVAADVADCEVAAPANANDGPAVAVLTQSVAESRSRRSLLRVMIMSPTLAWFPSPRRTSCPVGAPSRR